VDRCKHFSRQRFCPRGGARSGRDSFCPAAPCLHPKGSASVVPPASELEMEQRPQAWLTEDARQVESPASLPVGLPTQQRRQSLLACFIIRKCCSGFHGNGSVRSGTALTFRAPHAISRSGNTHHFQTPFPYLYKFPTDARLPAMASSGGTTLDRPPHASRRSAQPFRCIGATRQWTHSSTPTPAAALPACATEGLNSGLAVRSQENMHGESKPTQYGMPVAMDTKRRGTAWLRCAALPQLRFLG
jgi:hypothetical protein